MQNPLRSPETGVPSALADTPGRLPWGEQNRIPRLTPGCTEYPRRAAHGTVEAAFTKEVAGDRYFRDATLQKAQRANRSLIPFC